MIRKICEVLGHVAALGVLLPFIAVAVWDANYTPARKALNLGFEVAMAIVAVSAVVLLITGLVASKPPKVESRTP